MDRTERMERTGNKIWWQSRIPCVAMGFLLSVALGLGAVVATTQRSFGRAVDDGPMLVEEVVRVTGEIRAAEQAAPGEPAELEIVSPDMGTYLIDARGKGWQLERHVGKMVTLMAALERRDDGRKHLVVESFRVHET